MADVVYFYARKDDLDVLYEVPRDLLKAFGLKFGMIDADHADNMAQLLDRTRSGKRHLNGIQPLSKTVWIKPWTRSIEKFEHHRPRPATAPDFYDNFIRRLNREKNGEKAKIADKAKPTFGKFLNGTILPCRQGERPGGAVPAVAAHFRKRAGSKAIDGLPAGGDMEHGESSRLMRCRARVWRRSRQFYRPRSCCGRACRRCSCFRARGSPRTSECRAAWR